MTDQQQDQDQQQAQIDLRGMSKFYRQFAREGTHELVTFTPQGRDVAGIERDRTGRIVRKIFPATLQWNVYAGDTHECFVIDRKYMTQDGVRIAKAVPVDPFALPPDQWLQFHEYCMRLIKRVTFEKSDRGEPMAFNCGKPVFLHPHSRPVKVGDTALIAILEGLWKDEAYVTREEEVTELEHGVKGSALVKFFEAAGFMSDAEREQVIVEKVTLKDKATRVQDITAATEHKYLEFSKARVNVWHMLADKEVVGEENVVHLTDDRDRIKAAARRILRSVHPDQHRHHPLLRLWGGLEKAPYYLRRRTELKFDLLKQVAERTLAILDAWESMAKAEEEARRTRKQRPSRARERRRNNGQATQGAATQPAQASEPTDALAQATAEAPAQEAAIMASETDTASGSDVAGGAEQETPGATMFVTGNGCDDLERGYAPTDGTQTERSAGGTEAAAATEETKPVDPAIAKHLAREERRRQLQATSGKKSDRREQKAERQEPKKGLAALATLVSGSAEGTGSGQ